MIARVQPMPVSRTLRTPGIAILAILVGAAGVAVLVRFLFGLEAATNLTDAYPWGLWKAFNVAAGIAIAAGGFTTAAFVHVFRRHQYEIIVRPALLAAAIGYTFAVIGLIIDIGRYYNIWHPILPSMWQGDSVLFEIAMCVMTYLTVLYIELIPVVAGRFSGDQQRPRLARFFRGLVGLMSPVLTFIIIAGVVVSCLHQSSLGNLMVIAPSKVHPLWYTPVLALLFLLSAVAVGFPVVIFQILFASWALRIRPPIQVLSSLARYVPVLAGLYLIAKMVDLVLHGAYVHLFDASVQTVSFLLETVLGLLVPIAMLLVARIREDVRGLGAACLLIVAGVALNRLNVFLVGYQPPYATRTYFPSLAEFVVAIGLVAAMILIFRIVATAFPIMSPPKARIT